uniref:Putative secreted protein n=1 Tax=Ixodes ricinus TaxID=34613 RepID=A0A6B0U7S4_IXORI
MRGRARPAAPLLPPLQPGLPLALCGVLPAEQELLDQGLGIRQAPPQLLHLEVALVPLSAPQEGRRIRRWAARKLVLTTPIVS